jgi:uncharacterized protein (DUF1778 family)
MEGALMTQFGRYPLRLPQSLKRAVADAAARDGISINQFIMLAVAEKLAVIDTVRFFAERSERADLERFDQLLNRQGGEPPQPGDEVPA